MPSTQHWFQPGDLIPYSGKVVEFGTGREFAVYKGQRFPVALRDGAKFYYLVIFANEKAA